MIVKEESPGRGDRVTPDHRWMAAAVNATTSRKIQDESERGKVGHILWGWA